MRIRNTAALGAASKTITGIVAPGGWDDTGHVLSLCIRGDEPEVWFVVPGTDLIDLMAFVRKRVRATGRLSRRHGLPHLEVTHIELGN